LPLAWPGILAGLILSFAHTMGEFGVVLMVGGNIPGVTRTLSIAIYDDVQALNYEAAGRTSVFLVGFAFVVLCLTPYLARSTGPTGRWRRPATLPIGDERLYIMKNFTDRARKVMQLSNQEARRFNHEYIGTEHILLAIVKEGSGVAANVLISLNIDLRKIR